MKKNANLRRGKNNPGHSKGFTLIEILITIVIVAILAAIALPAYQSQIAKARRADAQAALIGLAQAMERHKTATNTYVNADDGSDVPIIYATTSPVDGNRTFYNLRITDSTPTTYELTAIPVGAQAGDGNLIYQSTGSKEWDKNSDGTIQAAEQCWEKTC